jgi:phenylpropionate dioxygenase-like ring-hydroxylating dioxygenase large terminal subunit
MLSHRDNEILCRVGPKSPMGELLRRFWTPILLSSELAEPDGAPREITVLGEDLLAFRDTDGQVGLIQPLCPHRQAPLVYGRNEDSGLRCIYHGWKFDTSGVCVDMPNEPSDSDFKQKVRTIAYPVKEWAGIIWAYLGPKHLQPELPALEWARVAPEQRYVVKYRQECNFVQAIEGDIDSSHIGFLHMDLDALRNPRTPEQRYRANDMAPRWVLQPREYGLMLAACRDAEEDTHYWRTNQWLMPYYTMIATDLQQRRGHGHIWVPIDDRRTQVWCVIWAPQEELTEAEKFQILGGPAPHIATLDPETGGLRANKSNHFFQDREAQRTRTFTGILGVREQDTAVVEGMGDIVDRTREHLGTSDMAIIGMRRMLINAAKALLNGEEPYAATHADVYRVRAWSEILERKPASELLNHPRVKELTTTMVE